MLRDSMKLLRGFTGEQNCRVLSGQSLHHRNPFLWRILCSSFSYAVVIVRPFQNVTALRVVIYILNVLTPDL